jgi:predicted dehydrogenase
MLDEVRPDVVGVFTPLHQLAEVSRACVRRGCHVASEKPLALTEEDLTALREEAAAAGVHVAAMFGMRQQPAFLGVRHAVAAGRIGEPILAAAQKSYVFGRRDDFYRRRETYGGTIPWVAIHALDFVRWCCGKDYARVTAMHGNAAHADYPGCEDHGGILLSFRSGGTAVIRFDYLRPPGRGVPRRHGDDRLRIAGSEGVIEIVEEGTRAKLMTPAGVEDVDLPTARNLFVSLLTAIAGGEPCLVSTEDSFEMTRVALLARRAADEGRVLDL